MEKKTTSGGTPPLTDRHTRSIAKATSASGNGRGRRFPMNLKTRWQRLSTREKRWVTGGAIGITAVLAFLAIVFLGGDSDSGGDEAARNPANQEQTGGMEGMAGMSMRSDGSVQLTAGQLREFGITFAIADIRMLEEEVRTVGQVNFDETRVARVSPKIGGFVERLYVDFTGKPVRRGQPLLEIYSPEMLAAQEEMLLAAKLQRTLGDNTVPGVPGGAPDLLEASKRRLRLWDISEAQISQVLREGRARRTLTLFAPASGVVVEKNVVRGQAIEPGENLYVISDLSEVWIEAEIREGDAGLVREGARVRVELAAFPGRELVGRVEYVYPTFEAETRTLKARIAVPNPGSVIKPGMYATVRLLAPVRSALAVPSSAVVQTGERNLVFVDMGGGGVMAHEVELGRVAGGYTEILFGIEPGQRVVTSAQFLIDSESNLAEVMKSMVGMGGSMEGMDMEGMDMSGSGTQDMKGMKMPPKKKE